MVRSYLRHEPTQAFGLICSPSNARAGLAADGKTATVPALEDVLVWDVKTGEQLSMWHEIGHRAAITALAHSPVHGQEDDLWAVGYADGSIRVWDAASSTVRLTLNGHKSAVTALQFDSDGLVLASGGQDTNITLWDIVAESGMFRLKGHRDAVTDLAFFSTASDDGYAPQRSQEAGSSKRFLFTTSKDGLLKMWDLSLQHCMETVLPGKGELWSLAVLQGKGSDALPQGGPLVLVGNSEGIVKIYETNVDGIAQGLSAQSSTPASKYLVEGGQLDVATGKRIGQISAYVHNEHQLIGITAGDRSVEVYRMRSEEDIRKKMARRRRRAREKAGKKEADGESSEDVAVAPTWADRIEAYTNVRPSKGRIKSFAFAEADRSGKTPKGSAVSVLLALSNNQLEVLQVPLPTRKAKDETASKEAVLAYSLELAGHRSEVRAIALSYDDALLASADSAGTLKVWNTTTGRMLRTLPCGYALSLAWLPDNQHVIVGCKDGSLKTYDVRSGIQLQDIAAHQGPIWSVVVHPDGQSCLTASGDKDVKFWSFEATLPEADEDDDAEEGSDEEDDASDAPRRTRASNNNVATLGLQHTRTLKMTDDVLCARFSPDGRLLALSLLDSTVKVFFADSLKFFLSLYGHKLPVLSLDISSDSKLCVTVSADKNAKIWGLDYGDCHRSLFAHEESILAVAFEKGEQGGGLMGGREGKSHRFWTCAKDGTLKYWDGDRFQCIQTLTGHHGDVTGLTIGSKGTFLVSSGADRSLRVWEKTDEPLFLEEERERELEEMYENGAGGLAAGQRDRDDDQRQYGSLATGDGADGTDAAAAKAGDADRVEAVTQSTRETMMAGERLLEAIELAKEDLDVFADYERQKRTTGLDLAPPARNALLAHAFQPGEDVDAHAYVLKTTLKILPAQLDDALLVLPFDAVMRLMRHLEYWARKEWNILLVSRILFFLLRSYHGQITSNRIMKTTLQDLRGHLRASLQRQKMTLGYNLAGLNYVQTRLQEQRTDDLYAREGFDLDEQEIEQRLQSRQNGASGQAQKRKLALA